MYIDVEIECHWIECHICLRHTRPPNSVPTSASDAQHHNSEYWGDQHLTFNISPDFLFNNCGMWGSQNRDVVTKMWFYLGLNIWNLISSILCHLSQATGTNGFFILGLFESFKKEFPSSNNLIRWSFTAARNADDRSHWARIAPDAEAGTGLKTGRWCQGMSSFMGRTRFCLLWPCLRAQDW